MTNNLQDDTYCSTREAARMLGVSLGTVQNMVERGTLSAWKTAGGHLLDGHLDLVEPEFDPVAAAHGVARAPPDRIVSVVEKRAVGAVVVQFPPTADVEELAMLLRQMTIGIDNDPLIVVSPANREFAAADLSPFGRHIVGTADRNELQCHASAHSSDEPKAAAP